MKTHMCKLVLFTTLCLCIVVSAAPQPQRPTTKLNKNSDIYALYDTAKDSTWVLLKLRTVKSTSRRYSHQEVKMGALYGYPGRTPSRPQKVALIFLSLSDYGQYLRDKGRALTVVADGVRIPLGTAESVEKHEGSNFVMERLAVFVPSDTFLRIAQAKEVEMRFGATEFKLKDKHLEAIRELAGSMPTGPTTVIVEGLPDRRLLASMSERR